MKRFLYGLVIGGGATYFGIQNYVVVKPSRGIEHEELTTVNAYVHHHHL